MNRTTKIIFWFGIFALILVAFALGNVARCEAEADWDVGHFNRVELRATPHQQVWHSRHKLSQYRELRFQVIVNGKEISGKGKVISNCRYLLVTPRLVLDLRNCGTSRISLRYQGHTDFVFRWRQMFRGVTAE